MGLAAVYRVGLALALALTAPVAMPSAQAQSTNAQCRALKAELASLSRAGNAAQYRRYDQALRRQASELNKAERMARRGGCHRTNAGQCRNLNATIASMRTNLANLRATRDRYGRSTGSASQRRAIEARIRDAGCDRQVIVRQQEPSNRRANTEVASVRPSMTLNPRTGQETRPAPTGPITSGYRSLCVRTCDGYFFPLAFDNRPPDFDGKQAACNALCPGTDVRVFAHRVPGEEAADMTDAAGRPYTALENAYAYLDPGHLENRPETCGCRGAIDPDAPQQTPVPEGMLKVFETEDGLRLPAPALRPDLHADPETRLNASTGLTMSVIEDMLAARTTGDETDLVADQEIRVVLPGFLPDPEAAEGPPAPAPSAVQ